MEKKNNFWHTINDRYYAIYAIKWIKILTV